jgi:hypothetical protein
MNSTPSKIFTVIVLDCENPSHARKIAELLRAAFPHRQEHVTTDKPGLTIKVKADSEDSIRKVISPALRKARPVFEESLSKPPAYMRFKPPKRSLAKRRET